MFEVTEFDPDEVPGFMASEEAAEFLGLPYSGFREIAPDLPRRAITPARFGHLRHELLESNPPAVRENRSSMGLGRPVSRILL